MLLQTAIRKLLASMMFIKSAIGFKNLKLGRVAYRIVFWRGETSQRTYLVLVYIYDTAMRILVNNHF